ncbi:FAD:protein FMN transferase [Aquincola sp. MAHUQ-54]|uniref:FAD:protein FMN transferase n=1 Tax=Aquincola agrisoli TaxID=3119538 RepID=A0AAW9Q5L3_9BURK
MTGARERTPREGGQDAGAGTLRHAFRAMGGPCEVRLQADDPALAARAARAAEAEVRRLEARFSRYRADSIASRINRSAGSGTAIEVDAETAALIDYAQTAWVQSEGLFDITSGVLRRVWDFHAARVPSQAEIAPVLALVGWQQVRWRRPWLSLPVAGMELDFGGYVKEYAADRAAAAARTAGACHGFVELGGDIALVGPHADGAPWRIGIRHPREPARAAAELRLARGAVASSGDYERCFEQGGRRYSHLLDPRSGWPVQGGLAAASVVAGQCLVAGTATTIAMLKGAGDGLRWLQALGLPYLAVDHHGTPHPGGGWTAAPGADPPCEDYPFVWRGDEARCLP